MKTDLREAEDISSPKLGRLQFVPGFLIRRLSNLFVMSWENYFSDIEIRITPVQAGILILIDENPGITQAEVAHILDVEGPTLVKSITRLEDAGLVVKSPRPTDRRAFDLNLSDKAKGLVSEIDNRLKQHERDVFAALSTKERSELVVLLQRVLASNMKSDAWRQS